jgi:IMP dehydrogenase/GMP reductase
VTAEIGIPVVAAAIETLIGRGDVVAMAADAVIGEVKGPLDKRPEARGVLWMSSLLPKESGLQHRL